MLSCCIDFLSLSTFITIPKETLKIKIYCRLQVLKWQSLRNSDSYLQKQVCGPHPFVLSHYYQYNFANSVPPSPNELLPIIYGKIKNIVLDSYSLQVNEILE